MKTELRADLSPLRKEGCLFSEVDHLKSFFLVQIERRRRAYLFYEYTYTMIRIVYVFFTFILRRVALFVCWLYG